MESRRLPSRKPEGGAELLVRVTPRSARDEIRVVEGQVQAWVTAAPADGAANDRLVALLAQKLSIAPSRIAILRGHRSRTKRVLVEGCLALEVLDRLRGA